MKHLATLTIITTLLTAILVIVSFCCVAFINHDAAKGHEGAPFWVKVFLSGTVYISALYVILSQKYDDEAKKWAFSVLTLVAGVWIGTVIS